MKDKKKLIICGAVVIGIAIIIVIAAIFLVPKVTDKLQDNQTTPGETKEITEIKDTTKSISYRQKAFLELYNQADSTSLFERGIIDLKSLDLGNSDNSCSGTLSFEGEAWKIWNFDTDCTEEEKNMETGFFSASDSNVKVYSYQQLENGFLALTRNIATADMGIVYFLENAVQWEKHFVDSSVPGTYVTPIDVKEYQSNLYVLGYAEKVAGGDFQNYLQAGEAFPFLVKLDMDGNVLSFINLSALNAGAIPKLHNILEVTKDQIYMTDGEQVVALTNETEVKVTKMVEQNGLLTGKHENNYLATIREEIQSDEDTTVSVGKVQLLNEDGTVKWTVSATEWMDCELGCTVSDFMSVSNFFVAVIGNQVFALDEAGKVVRIIDYNQTRVKGTLEDISARPEVVPFEEGFAVVTHPTSELVHIEEYNIDRDLIYEQTYSAAEIIELESACENIKRSYRNHAYTIFGTTPEGHSSGLYATMWE